MRHNYEGNIFRILKGGFGEGQGAVMRVGTGRRLVRCSRGEGEEIE